MYNKESETRKKAQTLAEEILSLSRNTLLVNLRFLDAAFAQLSTIELDKTTIATDGEFLIYNSRYVLAQYKEEKEILVRDYLHILLHCIFRHMFVGPSIQKDIWNLACDIAVENVISEFSLKSATTKRQQEQLLVINYLKADGKLLTAEKIYRYYQDNDLSGEEIKNLKKLFGNDDHQFWYMSLEEKRAIGINPLPNKRNTSLPNNTFGFIWTAIEERWKTISERSLQELIIFSKNQGNKAGAFVQNLLAVNREKFDYSKFLKKFAVRGEVLKVNDEEFDYVFYTYGLNLYKKMPLIEPLEYKDVKRIREFVIAIDTSGSVAGEIVQKFVQKTYSILKSTESFFSKINLHIIQCDACIQEEVKITTQTELDEYIKNMQIYGLGGTDFRPVFRRVDELVREGEFKNLQGMIYFTDGYGIFPNKKPDFKTAFVFLEEDCFNQEVPHWAIKLVLQKEEV